MKGSTGGGSCDPAVETNSNSTTLGNNLKNGTGGNADVDPKTVSTTNRSPQAHHIIPGKEGADELRELLANPPVCIGINDAVNGVWLPAWSGSSDNIANPKRVFHNHTRKITYLEHIEKLLKPQLARPNKAGVVRKLKKLRRDMTSGIAKWMPGEDPTTRTQ